MELAITVATECMEVQSHRSKHGPHQASVSSFPERTRWCIGVHPDTESLQAPLAQITNPERFRP